MILIIGANGSMGQRYQAILKSLRRPFDTLDLDKKHIAFDRYTHFILATPTDTHLAWIKRLGVRGKPILCEKPLAKNMAEVKEILECESPLSMMMQYKYIASTTRDGHSHYGYFRHGPDGLKWDCFQIIALANGKVSLDEEAPVWECQINGKVLSLDDMDKAYVEAVIDFLNGRYIDKADLLKWHKKVNDFQWE